MKIGQNQGVSHSGKRLTAQGEIKTIIKTMKKASKNAFKFQVI